VTGRIELGQIEAKLPDMLGLRSDVPKTPGGSSKADSPFAALLGDAIGGARQLEDQARIAVDGLMTGRGVDVHEAIIASEKASMAFELVLAVRNKAVQSYQSIMSMQF
jgi:flagellar hook-basal body complex protein FliE